MSDKDLMTYQLNPLINAKKQFNVIETRIFYLGLKDINPHITEKDVYFDTEFPDTYITPSELKNIFGNGFYLPEIKKACRKMIGTSIEIEYEDGMDLYTVFQHIKYREGKGLFLKFNEDMRPFILDIYKSYKKYGFTKIEMQQIFVLDSAYAMRLLELLLQYNGKKDKGIIKREMTVDEIRHKLSVPENTYKEMYNFRSRVLDLPIKEIERKTPYKIKYNTIKKGRKVVAFLFECDCNNIKKDDDYTETIEVEAISPEEKLEKIGQQRLLPPIEEQKETAKLYNKMMQSYRINMDNIAILLNDYCGGDIEELKARLEYGERRAYADKQKGKLKKNNLSGYIIKAIKENWLGEKRQEEEAQARELEAVATNADWDAWARDAMGDDPAPAVPERPLDPNDPMHQSIIGMIKKEIKDRNISQTTKDIFKKRGLTFQRFRELYMR